MSSMAGSGQGPWQIKRVESSTGPLHGSYQSSAIRTPQSVPGQTTLLWKSPNNAGEVRFCSNFGIIFLFTDGWTYDKSYRFKIIHHPDQGLIRLKLWEGGRLIQDSGDIIDNGPESLRGGRLGVYCDSQEQITWSALSYK